MAEDSRNPQAQPRARAPLPPGASLAIPRSAGRPLRGRRRPRVLSRTSSTTTLVELDPLNEDAHRRLIVAFAQTGRRGHALRQFLECRRALVTELGVEPGEETVALQRRVLAGEAI